MKKDNASLSDIWIKASIIGTTWAASEIVLGSFLHNLKIPFSSNLLTGIGIVILISASYLWKDRGLFWRAGLICALMKTMSPSAVIFGPMIAILSQSLLLETSVRLFGRTLAGFTIGAILAMSWNLFQKIINFIIFYGNNIIKVYESLVSTAQKQFHIQGDMTWVPILMLLIVYFILGLIAAIIGIKTGRKIASQPSPISTFDLKNDTSYQKKGELPFNYSLLWLLADILLMIGALTLIKNTMWYIWGTSIIIFVTIWSLRYQRAIRQLAKPKFWIFFVVIIMLTAFIFTKIQGNSLWQGLLTGLEMNFRAITIIVGFFVLGTELYNPKIQQFFLKTSFKQLPLALELSFESLPLMIAAIPDVKTLLKNPVSIIYQVISQAEHRLEAIKEKQKSQAEFLFITGPLNSRKTTFLRKMIAYFKENKVDIAGFCTPKLIENEKTIGYDLVNVVTEERFALLRQKTSDEIEGIGKYQINAVGLQKGLGVLEDAAKLGKSPIVIDEIGKLELNGGGWAPFLDSYVSDASKTFLVTVRKDFLQSIIKKWQLRNFKIFDVETEEIDQAINKVRQSIVIKSQK